MVHYVILEDYPVYWLGEKENTGSVEFLIELYSDTDNSIIKEDLIPAIGLHKDQNSVIPFFKDVISSKEKMDIREGYPWGTHFLQRHAYPAHPLYC